MDDLIENAPPLDQYLYSEHTKVVGAVEYIVDDILKPPKSSRKKYWKIARMLITNLWEAASASNNPWRGLSRDSNAYQTGTRYHKIYIPFLVVKIVDRLILLSYIEQINGKYNPATGFGRTARIRATDKLLELVKIKDKYSVIIPNPEAESETIFLKDENKDLVDYKDNERTETARKELSLLNELLSNTEIKVDKKALKDNRLVTLTDKRLYRVFNNNDLWAGGRIYGGFWQAIKREYRKTITINGEKVTELDFKANHPSMIYRTSTESPVPEDCYAIKGFDRNIAKNAMLMMINNSTKDKAANALVKKVWEKLQKKITLVNARKVIEALEILHEPILPFLYDPHLGMSLQTIEGEIAIDILFNLMKKNIPCLPIHDSFIVSVHHREQLRDAMIASYKKHLTQEPTIDIKY
ncbi:MAG: hypothetical protein DYH15_01080 [Nitrosomonas sp. PRO4]|nr:hypothetical protein [Nitrosomonas sp. PRO4]